MIALTGGAGFIGSNLLHYLNAQGIEDIVVVDQLDESAKWKNLVGARFSDYLEADTFLDHLHEESTSLSTVIHLGACSNTLERDSHYLMQNNTLYTRVLAQWCLEQGVRLIYASSGATYGDGAAGYDDDPDLLDRLHPLNMYGYSKHLFDLWARDQGWLDEIVGFKFFNVYGPRESHKDDMRSLVHKAWPTVNADGEMTLFKSHKPQWADGEQTRDFIWVDDVCRILHWALTQPEVHGLYNVGTGQASTWNALARALFTACGKREQIRYIDMPENIRDQYQYHTEAPMDRLRAAGYSESFTSLEEGVSIYVRWLKDNPGC